MNKALLSTVAMWLCIIGGLNWGLVGAFDYNAVNALFGSFGMFEDIVYMLVGISALYLGAMQLMGSDD